MIQVLPNVCINTYTRKGGPFLIDPRYTVKTELRRKGLCKFPNYFDKRRVVLRETSGDSSRRFVEIRLGILSLYQKDYLR